MIHISLASKTAESAARKTNRLPSGDQAGETSGPDPIVSCRIPVPSRLLVQISALLGIRSNAHARAIRPVPPPFPGVRVLAGCAFIVAVDEGVRGWLAGLHAMRQRASRQNKSSTDLLESVFLENINTSCL